MACDFDEFGIAERLSDKAAGAQRVTSVQVFLLSGRGQDHDGQQARGRVGSNALQDLESIQPRQLEIQKNDPR